MTGTGSHPPTPRHQAQIRPYRATPLAALAPAALLALLATSCGGSAGPDASVRIEGREVVLDGDRPLRAIRVDLEWDPSLSVNAITAAAGAERMNLLRVDLTGARARVLLADTRRLRLPPSGALLHIDATGDGQVRIVDVQAAEDGARLVSVEVE